MNAFLRAHPWATLSLFVPTIMLALVMLVLPFMNGVLLAFTDASPKSRGFAWVGLENFAYIFEDRDFWEVARNSLTIIVSSTLIAMLLGLALALLFNEGLRGTRLFRTLVFQGWVVPWIAIAVLWGWLFNFDYGIVNHVLVLTGVFDRSANWLADGVLAKIVIISGFVWRIIPFMMITILAALQGVSTELIEAAKIDGASRWQQIRFVYLPHLKPAIIVMILMSTFWTFNNFVYVWLTTGAGPGLYTNVMATEVYIQGFINGRFGYSAATGVVMAAIMTVFGLIYLRIIAERELSEEQS